MDRNVNFTKYLWLPLANFTYTAEVTDKTIKTKDNRYSYKALESKTIFFLIKYAPVVFLLLLITPYELQNSYKQILVSLFLVGIGLVMNLRYKNMVSFVVFLVWTLTYIYLFDNILNLPIVYKYALICYVLIQLILDTKFRQYYELYNKEDELVSYCYIEKNKI